MCRDPSGRFVVDIGLPVSNAGPYSNKRVWLFGGHDLTTHVGCRFDRQMVGSCRRRHWSLNLGETTTSYPSRDCRSYQRSPPEKIWLIQRSAAAATVQPPIIRKQMETHMYTARTEPHGISEHECCGGTIILGCLFWEWR